jgi:hypothetical protein
MQNRYVGDIGDYMKLAVLRALISGSARQLGVLWWLHPDERHNGDGKHRQYLARPQEWQRYDGALFEALTVINREGRRNIQALQETNMLSAALYFSEPIPCAAKPPKARPDERQKWLAAASACLEPCDLLFLDPDNGIAPLGLKDRHKRAGKSVMLEDLVALRRKGRAFVIYHHQTRHPGGHKLEFESLSERLEALGMRVCGALRAKPWSARLFLIIDGDDALCERGVLAICGATKSAGFRASLCQLEPAMLGEVAKIRIARD